jgi:hypothetical protein
VGCTIERELVLEMTDESVPLYGAMSGTATILADGSAFLAARRQPVLVLDADGNLTREVGRIGAGPGEYASPVAVLEAPGGYVVLDRALRRLTWLSPELDFRHVVTIPAMRALLPPIVFEDGRILLNALMLTGGSYGHPLHILTPESGSVDSFGGDGPFQLGDERALWRILAPASGWDVWVARPETARTDTYRIERWNVQGQMIATYERDMEAVLPSDAEERLIRLTQLHQDRQGRLWVKLSMWEPERATIVEVLDLEREEVVASARFDDWTTDVALGGFYARRLQSIDDPEPVITGQEIWRFRLRGR